MGNYFSLTADEQSARYYGWLVVGVMFLTMSFGGSIVGTFPIFYVAFLEEFGWSRAETALAFSASMVTFALMAGVVGAMVDRWGPKVVMPVGIALLGAGLALTSTTSSLVTLYVYYGVISALGITMIGFVPTSTVVSQWFIKRRATAMGVALSGRNFGSMLFVPLAAFLIGWIGWRLTYIAFAVGIVAFLFPLNLFLHNNRPYSFIDMSEDRERKNWTLRQALWHPVFWFFFVSGMAQGVGFSVIGIHQVAHMVDVGFSKIMAASLLGIFAILRALGGVSGGWIADRFGRNRTFVSMSLLSIVGVYCLMVATPEKWLYIYFFVLFFGISGGARGTVFVALKADMFPGSSFGRILGVSLVGTGIASGFGPWLAGYIFDVSGSYQIAFWFVIAMNLLSIIFVVMAVTVSKREQQRKLSN